MSKQSGREVQLVESKPMSAIAEYGDPKSLQILVSRLMRFHPAADDVGEPGMMLAAQLSLLMGASPLPATNEIHIWKDKGKVVVTPGINFWRRRSIQYGGVFDGNPRPMTTDEAEHYGLAKNELGAICKGIPTPKLKEFLGMGLTFNQAVEHISCVGIGVVTRNEYSKKGRPLIWTALKRAETDFHKQAFPYAPGERLEPGLGMSRQDDGTYSVDNSSHWAGLAMKLADVEEEEADEQFLRAPQPAGKVDVDAVNAELFGVEYDEPTQELPDVPEGENDWQKTEPSPDEDEDEYDPADVEQVEITVKKTGKKTQVYVPLGITRNPMKLAEFHDAVSEGIGSVYLSNYADAVAGGQG